MSETIVILTVEYAPTTTGKPRWIVNHATDKLSVWDEEVARDLHAAVGKAVECKITTSKTGNYRSISGAFPSTGVAKPPISPVHSIPNTGNGARVGNAMKLAVELISSGKLPMVEGEILMEKVKVTARHLIKDMIELEKEVASQ